MTAVSCHCEGATHLERPWQSQGSEAETCNNKTEANSKSLELNGITTSCAVHTPRNDKPHSTHFIHFTHAKRAAFTLAEVLITLAIIGVVAAMTIPTLIANYQKKVLKTQFMKKYAEISQAVLLAKSETYGNFKAYCIKYDGTSF